MKKLALLLIGILIFACEDDNTIIVNPVEVINLNHPFEIQAGDTVSLNVTAQAPNSCWSDIEIELIQLDEFNYEVLAEAKFDVSLPNCENDAFNKVETFTKTFSSAGEYTFKLRKSRTVFEDNVITVTE
jgi:hypothetical protein